MESTRPPMYFLKESDKMLEPAIHLTFISDDDLKEIGQMVPRTPDNIWIYERLTRECLKMNEAFWDFEISGFGQDIVECEQEQTIEPLKLVLGATPENSIIKLVVIISLNNFEIEICDKKYPVGKGALIVFPSYLLWRFGQHSEAKYLFTILVGHHFR